MFIVSLRRFSVHAKRVKKKLNYNSDNFAQAIYPKTILPGVKKDVLVPLPKSYSPRFVEYGWRSWWEKSGIFDYDPNNELSEVFVMCLPPPNITGKLHLGHAFSGTIQDAVARYQRMIGRNVLWKAGVDHAGIATQVVVENILMNTDGKTRFDLGRDGFLKRINQWQQIKKSEIISQLKELELNVDFSNIAYTMDENMSKAVNEAFCRFYEEGYIYQADRIVNWCCHLQSTVAETEVEEIFVNGPTMLKVPSYDKEIEFGNMYYINYNVVDSDESVTVATTRPETIPGDAALAVNPFDDRYSHLETTFATNPLTNMKIPIIFDDRVDICKGTGVVKITPAHSSFDWEIAKTNALSFENILDNKGNLTVEPWCGVPRYIAREKIIEKLQTSGFLVNKVPHKMTLPICCRSEDILEPLLKKQWFLRVKDLVTDAANELEKGSWKIVPHHHSLKMLKTLRNAKDWCLSRQIWWGHRIPVFHVSKDQRNLGIVVSRTESEALCEALKLYGTGVSVFQDEDVLDTWFSSSLYPFVVIGWPENRKSLYPTTLLVTAKDIMELWVQKMAMIGLKLTGVVPFKEVLVHTLIRDKYGRKMSKSRGNIVDPMRIVEGCTVEDLIKDINDSGVSGPNLDNALDAVQKHYPDGIPSCGLDALRLDFCSNGFNNAEEVSVAKVNSQILFVIINNPKQEHRLVEMGARYDSLKILNNEESLEFPKKAILTVSLENFSNLLKLLKNLGIKIDSAEHENVQHLSYEDATAHFSIDEILSSRFLCNKLHHAFTFYSLKWQANSFAPSKDVRSSSLDNVDKWILSRLQKFIAESNAGFQNLELHRVSAALRKFLYTEFCSVYLEFCKSNDNPAQLQVSFVCLEQFLRCICPIMPFISEELYQRLPSRPVKSIFQGSYPCCDQHLEDDDVETQVYKIRKMLECSSMLKSFLGLTNNERPAVNLVYESERELRELEPYFGLYNALSCCRPILFGTSGRDGWLTWSLADSLTVQMNAEHLAKPEKQIHNLLKQKQAVQKRELQYENYLKKKNVRRTETTDPAFDSFVSQKRKLDSFIDYLSSIGT